MDISKSNNFAHNMKLFHEGKSFNLYKFLGSRLKTKRNVNGVEFSLWAPNAVEIRIVGSFNQWNGAEHIMAKNKTNGIWTLFIPELSEGELYKYEIHYTNGQIVLKSDPFAFHSQLRPNTASVVIDIFKDYPWEDNEWMEKKKNFNPYENPINIYEVHLGSWIRNEDNGFYSYRDIGHKLLSHVLHMGYTHIELLPLSEHPLDGSWGYQATGYYSLTSRFGNMDDFKYFVNLFHNEGIGIIMDWVPGHFCKDEHGLYNFDGTSLYEYDEKEKSENYGWGTANFNLGKPEVQSFLISNAVFLFDVYHIDGIRSDAVANMLYLSYGKNNNCTLKNKYGGDENLEAIEFIKKLNEVIFRNFPNPLMIAEESTSWPLVTKPTYIGGLGFNYKWNMGWMNDMLKYMEMDPIYKKWHHDLITFSLMYAFSENFILPLSHDEVVHGKKSLLDKMPGSYEDKFASLRMFYGYTMSHPGKKLLFMGGEFGQFIEWRYDNSLDWNLLSYPMHEKLMNYVRDLNHIYKNEPAMWELDSKEQGFSWIDHQNYNQSIISFARKSKDKDDYIVVVCNFTPTTYEDYKVGVPRIANYVEIFNSDSSNYGGTNTLNQGIIPPINERWNNESYCISIKIPPLSVLFLKPQFKKKQFKEEIV